MLFFVFIRKTLPLNNLKTRADINAKILFMVISAECIIYCTFKLLREHTFMTSTRPVGRLFQNIASTCGWMQIWN